MQDCEWLEVATLQHGNFGLSGERSGFFGDISTESNHHSAGRALAMLVGSQTFRANGQDSHLSKEKLRGAARRPASGARQLC